MAEKKRLAVEYSKHSLNSAAEIVAYLKNKFSQKEIDAFYQTLEDFEKIISLYPALYNQSNKVKIRRAVLNKVLSVYYTSSESKVSIIDIHDNRWDFAKRIK
jgi:arsenate reductase-like glutaredoxin family protein